MRPGTYHAREGFNWIRARKGLHFRLLFSFRCGRRIQTSVEVCHLQNCDFNWSRMPSDSQRAQNSGVSSSGSDPRRPALKNGAGSTDIARVSLRSLCRKVLGCGLITGSATKTQKPLYLQPPTDVSKSASTLSHILGLPAACCHVGGFHTC